MGGKTLKSQARQVIYNVYMYFLREAKTFKKENNGYFQKVQKRVSEACGVSVGTVKKILKESDKKNKSAPFPSPKRGRKNKRFRLNLDGFDYCVIRKMVYEFHLRYKEPPCLRTLKSELAAAIQFKGCLETLRKILNEMGFRYMKTESNKEVLMEKHAIRLTRSKYLQVIQNMRAEGRNIVYMDESYVHSSRIKGEHFIIIHAGNEKGFVPGALMMHRCIDSGGEYHKEINEEQYLTWLRNQLIPNLPPNSVLVIDNASYHNKLTIKLPNSNTPKPEIVAWLQEHDIPHDPNSMISDLYDIVKKNKEQFSEFFCDRIMEENGHTILRLPQHHSDLNPIENIWIQIQEYIATKAVARNVIQLKDIVLEKINMIGPEEWKKVCDKAICCEDEYRHYNQLFESYTGNLILNTCSSSDESDNSGEQSDTVMSE